MNKAKLQAMAYIEWCEYVKRMTRATIITKRKALERFLNVTGTPDLTKLTNYQFDDWRSSLAKQGLAGKTINNYADHVACCIKWLHIQRKLPVAMDLNLIERAEEDEPEVTVYTEAEVLKALESSQGPRERIVIALAYQSGLRLSELARLQVSDIDGLALNVKGKNRTRRRTFMRQDTRKLLDKWLSLNDIYDGYVFPSPIHYDKPLTNQQVSTIIKQCFKRAGIAKRAHPHALRHTWFTIMLDNGAPLMDTAIMGGHQDPATTKRYYHASPKRHSQLHKTFIPEAGQLNRKRVVNNTPDLRHPELL